MKLRKREGLRGDKLCTAGREKNITFSRWWIFPISQRQVHKLVQLGEESGNEWVWTAKRPQSWWLILLSGKLNQIASLKQSACTPLQQTYTHTHSLTHMHKHTLFLSVPSIHTVFTFGQLLGYLAFHPFQAKSAQAAQSFSVFSHISVPILSFLKVSVST